MQIHICITKDDINVVPLGKNFEVVLPGNIFLNFTQEAVNELHKSVSSLQELEGERTINI